MSKTIIFLIGLILILALSPIWIAAWWQAEKLARLKI